MTALPDLFPGFAEHRATRDGVELYARVGGSGPPLLLLHGYPQTHVCFHRVAPALANEFQVVVADLRGYGQSSAPAGDSEHLSFSKREMARDAVALMASLGHRAFMLVGHDRGGRVGYRLALDEPGVLTRLALLDILPTFEVWDRLTADGSLKSYHWTFLAQPHPMPESLIAAAAKQYCDHTLASWTLDKSLDGFDRQALARYRAQMANSARVHAMCEDYRAGATCDRVADATDKAAGKRIACPTLVLWGSNYVGRSATDPTGIWREWCADVRGSELQAGHFLAEENPDATLAALLPFLRGN